MRNRLLGLGIFALIFSLNLLFSGTSEAKLALQVHYAPQCDDTRQEVQIDLEKMSSNNGILSYKTETSQAHQVVRKFPAAVGLLFLLLNQHIKENPQHLSAVSKSFSPTKDLSVSFHNLRI